MTRALLARLLWRSLGGTLWAAGCVTCAWSIATLSLASLLASPVLMLFCAAWAVTTVIVERWSALRAAGLAGVLVASVFGSTQAGLALSAVHMDARVQSFSATALAEWRRVPHRDFSVIDPVTGERVPGVIEESGFFGVPSVRFVIIVQLAEARALVYYPEEEPPQWARDPCLRRLRPHWYLDAHCRRFSDGRRVP